MSFTFLSPVYFDEFDPNGHLHNARFAIHAERAQSAYFDQYVGSTAPSDRIDDLHYVVREMRFEFLAPFSTPGLLPVTLGGRSIGTTSATYDITFGDDPVYARGHRVVVKINHDGRSCAWSDWYRKVFGELSS